MEPIQIEFSYDGINTILQCKANEKLENILKNFKSKAKDKKLIYMYNDIKLQNEELTFNEIANPVDKERKKMNILVVEDIDIPVPSEREYIIKSKNIICPECKEDIKFKIVDYVINLYECKNKHDIDNIFLNEFDSTQNIDISKIICQNCGKYNKGNTHTIYFINVILVKKIYFLFVIQIMIKNIKPLTMMIIIISVKNIINYM